MSKAKTATPHKARRDEPVRRVRAAKPKARAAEPDAGAFETVTVTHDVLVETPARVLALLIGVKRIRPVLAAMEKRGFSPAVRRDGWHRLSVVTGFRPDGGVDAPTTDSAVRDAVTELGHVDDEFVRLARATLQHNFPAQSRFVLDGLEPTRGSGAVLVVATLLDRIDALTKKGSAGRGPSEGDVQAVAALARRGLDARERARLRALVDTALGATDAGGSSDDEEAARAAAEDAAHLVALRALRAWFEEWSEIAHIVVKRRDYLIQMGLGQRKARVQDEPGASAGPAAGPADGVGGVHPA